MKMIKVKKLFLGYISIRDYIVEDLIKKKQGIKVKYRTQIMTVPYGELRKKFQVHKLKFRSQYSTKTYELYDFPFIPDEMNKEVKK